MEDGPLEQAGGADAGGEHHVEVGRVRELVAKGRFDLQRDALPEKEGRRNTKEVNRPRIS